MYDDIYQEATVKNMIMVDEAFYGQNSALLQGSRKKSFFPAQPLLFLSLLQVLSISIFTTLFCKFFQFTRSPRRLRRSQILLFQALF